MTLFIAYLGGLLSLVSPCSALVIPTFIAAASSKKQALITTTAKFSLGLGLVLLPLSIGFIALSGVFNYYRQPLTFTIGILFLLYALWLLWGKSLPVPDLTGSLAKKFPLFGSAGTIMLGMVAGIGSTTCVGPILGAILTLSASSGSTLQASLSMTAYMGGIVSPLIFLSLIAPRIKPSNVSWLHRPLPGIASHLSIYKLFMVILFTLLSYLFIIHQANLSSLTLSRHFNWLNTTLDLQDSLFR